MPRGRRSSAIRRLFGLLVFAGFVASVGAGIVLVRDAVADDDQVVLVVDNATGDTPNTIPLDAAAVDREPPQAIRIGDLRLDNIVVPVGIEEDGELEVPDETEVGWYQYGSAPGLPGATVLAAHVSWNRTIGPFHQLGNLEPGAEVDVITSEGATRVYQVVERAVYNKDELPVDRIWTTIGDETLVLITCGGDYNPNIRRYQQNIVIYAVPIDQIPADGATDSTVPGSTVPGSTVAPAADA